MSNKNLQINQQAVAVQNIVRQGDNVQFNIGAVSYNFRRHVLPNGEILLEQQLQGGSWQRLHIAAAKLNRASSHVIVGDKNAKISEQLPGASADLAQQALCPNAPMPGLVRQILVKVGDKVQPGQPLVVMEAMKLQMTLSAGGAGKITAVLVQEGELVSEDAQLLQMVASDA